MKLFWYVLAAFAIGAFVGWVSCGRKPLDGTDQD